MDSTAATGPLLIKGPAPDAPRPIEKVKLEQLNDCQAKLYLDNPSSEAIALVALRLEQCPAIRVLKVRGQLSGEAAGKLGEAMKALPKMEFLNLSFLQVDKEGFYSLLYPLQSHPSLKSLNLSNTPIGNKEAQGVAMYLNKTQHLAHLTLFGNDAMTAGGVLSLLNVLPYNGSLIHLDLRLSRGWQKIELLEKAFIEALTKHPTLQSLDLQGQLHSYEGDRTFLGPAIQANHTLVLLNLSDCGLKAIAAQSIAEGLKLNVTLVNLWLDHNELADKGAEWLAGALKMNRSLHLLSLAHNQITKKGALALAKGIEDNRTLATLNLAHNPIQKSPHPTAQFLEDFDLKCEPLIQHLKTNRQLSNAAFQAALKGDLPLLVQLLKRGASPFAVDASGSTLLHTAYAIKHQEMVSTLITLGLSPYWPAKRERTPIELSYGMGEPLDTQFGLANQQLQLLLGEYLGKGPQKGLELLAESLQYQQLLQGLQNNLMNEIENRQSGMQQEMLLIKHEQNQLQGQTSLLYGHYQVKQQRLNEQQLLQNPPSLRTFYTVIEQQLGAKFMSAILLTGGMIQRDEKWGDKVSKLGTDLLGGAAEGIPFVGGVVGSLLSFSIEELSGAAIDYLAEKGFKRAQESLVRPKEALAIAELIGRRLAMSYADHIIQNKLAPEEAAKYGKKVVKLVYNYFKEGKLRDHVSKSVNEKVEIIVTYIHALGSSEKRWCLIKRKGGLFAKPVQPTLLQPTLVELKPTGPAKIATLTQTTMPKATELFQLKGREVIQKQSPYQLTHQGPKVHLSLTIPNAVEELKELAGALLETFASSIIADCHIENQTLVITTTATLVANDIAEFFKQSKLIFS
ncbi:MAG: hypothetical protein AB7F31_02855 [Parachlamydiales bacterium]